MKAHLDYSDGRNSYRLFTSLDEVSFAPNTSDEYRTAWWESLPEIGPIRQFLWWLADKVDRRLQRDLSHFDGIQHENGKRLRLWAIYEKDIKDLKS